MSLIELNKEEANLVKYIALLDAANDPTSDYSVSVNIEVNFSKSKVQDALNVQYSNDPSAPKVYLSQEQFKNKWPMNYEKLTEICGARYIDFKRNNKYHDLRKSLLDNPKYAITRKLDEDNPRSIKQNWFGEAVFTELDKHYLRK